MNIEELAREAEVWAIPGALLPSSRAQNERLAIFAALVLEEAAKVCDIKPGTERWEVQGGEDGAQLCDSLAAAIRALKPVAS